MNQRHRILVIIATVLLTDALMLSLWLLRRSQSDSSPTSVPTPIASNSSPAELRTTPLPSASRPQGQSAIESKTSPLVAPLPAWAIPYGKEPWKVDRSSGLTISPSNSAAGLNVLGQTLLPTELMRVVEKVSTAFRKSSDSAELEASGGAYRAHLAGDVMQMELDPSRGTGLEETAVVTTSVRTISVRRESSPVIPLRSATADDWVHQGNTLQCLRDPESGWVEHYEATSSGLELTWFLPRPVSGGGSLWVEAEIGSLHFVSKTASGIHFADAFQTSRLRVGSGVVVDATGRRQSVTPEFVEGVIRYEIPESYLSSAQFPIALDPLISPEFGVDLPVKGNAYEAQNKPAVAWDGSTFLVSWRDHRREDLPFIVAARVSTNGAVLDPSGIVIASTPSSQEGPVVAGKSGTFLVAWTDDRDLVGEIYGARILDTGVNLDPAGLVLVSAPKVQNQPALAVQGDHFLLVWTDYRNDSDLTNPDIYGERVSLSGTILGTGAFPICNPLKSQTEPRVAVSGTTALVVWTDLRHGASADQTDIYGARVDESGVVIDTAGFLMSSQKQLRGAGADPVPNAQRSPSVAGSTNGFLVVWQDDRNGVDSDIYGSLVTLEGSVVQTNGVPLCVLHDLQAHPVAASDGSGFFVLWEDRRNGGQDIFGTRVDPRGVVLDSAGIAVSTADVNQSFPSLIFGAGGYLAAWEDTRSGLFSDIYAARLSPGAKLADPTGFLVSSSENQQHLPSVGWNGQVYLVAWRDYRRPSGFDLYATRVTTGGSILDPNGIRVSQRASFNSYAGIGASGSDFLLAWEYQSPGKDHDLYGRRVSNDGVVLDPDDIPIAIAPGEQYRASVAGTGSGWLVAWGDNRVDEDYDVYGALLNQAGQVTGTPGGFPICAQPELQFTVRLAWNGTNFLAVWRDSRNSPSSDPDFANRICDIYGRLISPTGELIGTNDIPICTELIHNQRFPTVATDGDGFFVVWEDRREGDLDVYGSLISNAGVVGKPDGFPICAVAGDQTIPVVTWDGQSYWVAWKDGRSGNQDIYGREVSRTGIALGAESGLALATGAQDQILPWIISAGQQSALLVYQTKLPDLIGRVGVRLVNNSGKLPPAFGSTPIPFAAAGKKYRYQVVVRGADLNPVAISGARLPGWLSLNDLGGGVAWLEGQPSETDLGIARVVLTASQGAFEVAQVFDLTVISGLPALTQVRIQSITPSLIGSVVCWDSIPGRIYRLEAVDQVDSGLWSVLSRLTAIAPSSCFTDVAAPGLSRFYRVLVEP